MKLGRTEERWDAAQGGRYTQPRVSEARAGRGWDVTCRSRAWGKRRDAASENSQLRIFFFSFFMNLAIRQKKWKITGQNLSISTEQPRSALSTRLGHHHSPSWPPRKTTPRVDRMGPRETCSCPQGSYRKAFPVICIKMVYLQSKYKSVN